MNYFQLYPKDQRQNTWLFYTVAADERLRLKPHLERIRCPECHKIDERVALSTDLGQVATEGKTDWVGTSDDMLLCKGAVADRLVGFGVQGFERIEIGMRSHVVLWPTLLAATDAATAGLRTHGGNCGTCGRPREVTGSPRLSSMVLPEAPLALFASEVWSESRRGRRFAFIANAATLNLLKRQRITGFEASRVEL